MIWNPASKRPRLITSIVQAGSELLRKAVRARDTCRRVQRSEQPVPHPETVSTQLLSGRGESSDVLVRRPTELGQRESDHDRKLYAEVQWFESGLFLIHKGSFAVT